MIYEGPSLSLISTDIIRIREGEKKTARAEGGGLIDRDCRVKTKEKDGDKVI